MKTSVRASVAVTAGVRRTALALAAFLLGGSAVAASKPGKPHKPAWQWTLDERLDARFDPEVMKVRDADQRAMAARARFEELESSESDALAHCRSLAQALAAAKAEFGEEIFLRLLYQEVAPSVSITYSLDERTRDRLRSLENGCQ